jgi:putative transposase
MKNFTTFEALLKPLTSNLLEAMKQRFDSDYYAKTFKSEIHLGVMLYAQYHDLKSLRDIEVALSGPIAYKRRLGLCGVKRTTLSDANHRRSYQGFVWLAKQLMSLLPRKQRQGLNKQVKKLDSSPIQLRGKGHAPWTLATRTPRCQGLKLHVEYEGMSKMPHRIELSAANVDDCTLGQQWPLQRNTVYVFDKGYCDYNWWWKLETEGAYFVTRLKYNAAIEIESELVCRGEKILQDSLVRLKNRCPRAGKQNLYQRCLRRVVVERENKAPLLLVSNLLDLPAQAIADLYRERWEVELFFKWVKQNLRIKHFIGHSENAVKLQIAVALIAYILLGIYQQRFKPTLSLHQLLIWIRHHGTTMHRKDRHYKAPVCPFEKPPATLYYAGGYL